MPGFLLHCQTNGYYKSLILLIFNSKRPCVLIFRITLKSLLVEREIKTPFSIDFFSSIVFRKHR